MTASSSVRPYAGNSPYSLPLKAKPTELSRGAGLVGQRTQWKFRCCMFDNKIPDDFENPPGNLFRSQKGHGRRGRLVTISTSNMVNATRVSLHLHVCLTPTHVCLVIGSKMSSALGDRSEADKLVLRVGLRLKMSFHFLWLYFKTYWLIRQVLLHAYTRAHVSISLNSPVYVLGNM